MCHGPDKSLQVSNGVCQRAVRWHWQSQYWLQLALTISNGDVWGCVQGTKHLWCSLCSQRSGILVKVFSFFCLSICLKKKSPSKHLASLRWWLGEGLSFCLWLLSFYLLPQDSFPLYPNYTRVLKNYLPWLGKLLGCFSSSLLPYPNQQLVWV